MKTIEKIRQKIEELYDGEAPAHDQQCEFEDGYFTGLATISNFLSTLESGKPMNPNDAMKELDEKIALVKQRGTWDGVDVDKYMDKVRGGEPEKPCHTVEEWMEHIKNADALTKAIFSKGPYNVLYDALNRPYRDCYDAIKEFGELCYQTARQDMMKEAVEGKIIFLLNGDVAVNIGDTDKYNLGQKIRVIVLPKEDEK